MTYRSSILISAAIIAAMFAASLWAWQFSGLEPVPVHFGMDGQPDRWMAAPGGWFVMPLVSLAVAALLLAVPFFDKRIERSSKAYATAHVSVMALLGLVHGLIVTYYLGLPISRPHVIIFAVGALFVALGNTLGKVRQNRFFGIRTPWTLRDEWVWDQTHRFGGYVFVIAGVTVMIAALFAPVAGRPLFLATIPIILIAALAPCVKSYLLWRSRETHQ